METYSKSVNALKVTTSQPNKEELFAPEYIDSMVVNLEKDILTKQEELAIWQKRKEEAVKLGIKL